MLRESFVFLSLTGFLLCQSALAAGSQSRAVIGGDLVFTSSATGASQDEALFRAEAQAVRMITIECSVPHRETKIFNQVVTPIQGPTQGRFQAQVSAGLPMASCEEAQNASPAGKKLLTSETLAFEQSAYEKVLFGEKVLVKSGPAKVDYTPSLFTQLRRADYQFNQPFMVSYQRYLSDKTDCREKVRYLIRQGDNAQADSLMMQCR
jgi:hypothetical protein